MTMIILHWAAVLFFTCIFGEPEATYVVAVCISTFLYTFQAYGRRQPLRQPYANWLMLNNWRPTQPLPYGPMSITITDGILVLSYTFVGMIIYDGLFYLSVLAYLISANIVFMQSYFNNGRLLRLWSNLMFLSVIWLIPIEYIQELLLGIIGVMYVANVVSFKFLLKRWYMTHLLLSADPEKKAIDPDQLPWPAAAHLKYRFDNQAYLVFGFFSVLSMHMFVWAWAAPKEAIGDYGVMIFLFALIMFMECKRILLICRECKPPLSIAGRLNSLRLIIPEYDVIFLRLLLFSAVGAYVGLVHEHTWWTSYMMATLPMVFACIYVFAKPSMRRWVLLHPRHVLFVPKKKDNDAIENQVQKLYDELRKSRNAFSNNALK